MIVLALDSATDRATLALGTPQHPGPDVAVPNKRDLSRDIDRLVSELLRSRGARPQALDGVLVADGPGSFTGLRIGVAFAKGLCRARGLPLYSAPSMLGAAHSACASARLPVCAVVVEYDALRGDVYRAAYRFANACIEVEAAPALSGRDAPPAAGAVRADERQASAAALLRLIGTPGGPRQIGDPATWEPTYGRLAEAESRRLARDERR